MLTKEEETLLISSEEPLAQARRIGFHSSLAGLKRSKLELGRRK